MRRRLLSAAAAVLALSGACRRAPVPARSAPAHPTGSGIWFSDGFGSERDESDALAAMKRGEFTWVLLPGARIERQGGSWIVEPHPYPPTPVAGIVVSPVISGGDDVTAALAGTDPALRRTLEDALALAVKSVMAGETHLGGVAGVHLDLPVTVDNAAAVAEFLARARPRFPRGLFVSVTLNLTPPADGAERVQALAGAADGLVAMVFGEDAFADPAATDQLGRPWWAGYAANALGRWTGRRGESREPLSEGFLARISDDPRLLFQHDMEVEERAGLGYLFRARRPVVIEGRRFEAGDEVAFRQPFVSDLIRRLGTDLAGRHVARGRVFRFAGKSESDRIFTLAALDDILLGRPLAPGVRVSVERGQGTVTVGAENLSAMPSVISRAVNWFEVDLGRPGIRDVRPGGFERYEVYAANGRPVSLGRASRVRFFETLVGPFEKIAPATVILTRAPADACCRVRYHVLAAAGPETATDWARAGR